MGDGGRPAVRDRYGPDSRIASTYRKGAVNPTPRTRVRPYRMRRALTDPRRRAGGRRPEGTDDRVKVERTPCVKGALHVGQTRAGAAASAALVHPSRVVGAPRSVSGHPWSGRTPASEGQPLGDPAPHDHGASHGPEAQRDHRLPRGWAEPHRDGDERLGRWRAGLVAEPPGASRHERRSRRRATPGEGSRGEGGRTVAPLGRWREVDAKLDAFAALRSSETAVVILEPRPSG
jgi:hypothetical protein